MVSPAGDSLFHTLVSIHFATSGPTISLPFPYSPPPRDRIPASNLRILQKTDHASYTRNCSPASSLKVFVILPLYNPLAIFVSSLSDFPLTFIALTRCEALANLRTSFRSNCSCVLREDSDRIMSMFTGLISLNLS